MPYDLSNNNTKYYIRNTDIEKWFMLKLYTLSVSLLYMKLQHPGILNEIRQKFGLSVSYVLICATNINSIGPM